MAHYMVTGSYTSEAWAAQVKNPQNRLEAVRPLFEASGGKIESAYYTFGAVSYTHLTLPTTPYV